MILFSPKYSTIPSLVQGQGRTQPCLPPHHLHLQIPVQLHLRQPQLLMLQQLPLQRLLPPSPRPPRPRKRPPVLKPLPPRQQPLRRLPPPPQLLPRFLVQSLTLGRAILTA